MKFTSYFWLGLGLSVTLAFSSCKKDEIVDPIIPNEQEIITTLTYTLTPTAGGTAVVMSFMDLDGDGPDAPTVTVSGELSADTQYASSLLLLNETATPTDTVNAEILEEAVDHQFFFITEDVDLSVDYTDMDSNGHPLGLTAMVQAGEASEGSIRIVLRHQPDKSAEGVAQGSIDNAGGETDIEATFDVVID